MFTMLAVVFDQAILMQLKKNLLRSQTTQIKVSRHSGRLDDGPADLDLSAEHVPDVERMMRGVMIACGITKDEIERMLRDRRDREGGLVN